MKSASEQSRSSAMIKNRLNSKLQRPYNSPYGNYVSSYLPKLPNHYTNLHRSNHFKSPQPNFSYRSPPNYQRHQTRPPIRRSTSSTTWNSHQFSEPTPGSVLYPPRLIKFKSLPIQKLFQTATSTRVARPTNLPKIYPFYVHEAMDRNDVIQSESVPTTTSKPQTIVPIKRPSTYNLLTTTLETPISSKLKIDRYDSGGFVPMTTTTTSPNLIENYVTPEPIYRYTVVSKNGGHISRSIPAFREYQRKSSVLSTRAVERNVTTPNNVFTLSTLLAYAVSSTEMPAAVPKKTPAAVEDSTEALLKNHRMEENGTEIASMVNETQTNPKYSELFRTVRVLPNFQWVVLNQQLHKNKEKSTKAV